MSFLILTVLFAIFLLGAFVLTKIGVFKTSAPYSFLVLMFGGVFVTKFYILVINDVVEWLGMPYYLAAILLFILAFGWLYGFVLTLSYGILMIDEW